MSYIEFQVSTAAFLSAQRTALRSQQICTIPQTVAGIQIVIDKIEFGNNAIRHDVFTTYSVFFSSLTSDKPGEEVDGKQTQIAQDVTVHVTTMSDIMSRPNQAPATIIKVPGTMIFDLDFYSLDDDCYTRTQFNKFEPGPLPPIPAALPFTLAELMAAVNTALHTQIPSKTVPAGLSKLTTLFAKFENAGMSVDGQLQRICLRAQIGGSHPGVKGQWANFFQGNFVDRLGNTDWIMYMDAGLITEFAKAKINQAIAEADVDHLSTFPGCHYSNNGGKAVFTLDVLAIYDLPDPLPNPSADPKLPLEIGVSANNTLQLRADYSDIVRLIHSVDLVEFFLPALSNGIEGFMQSVINSALADLNKKDNAPYCKKISNTMVECTKYVQMPAAASGTTSVMTSLLAQDDGIALAGTMRSGSLTPAVITTRVREFKWQPPRISCSTASLALVAAFMDSANGFLILNAAGIVDNSGTTPLFMCGWNIVQGSDPLGAFPPSLISVDAGPAGISFTATIPIPKDAYYANPYPLLILVRTTAGTRLLKIAPPPKVTKADLDKLAAALLVKVGNCEQLVSPWFNTHRGLNPAWLVDPPDESRYEHLWQVEITGLHQGESASLVDRKGKELVRVTARLNEPVTMSAMLPPAGAKELTVTRGAGRQRVALKESQVKKARGIQVGQQLMEQLGSISLGEPCRSLYTTNILAGHCVIAVLQNSIRAYDFTNPFRPSLIRSWQISNVKGVIDWQGALLHYGEDGFGWIDSEGNQRPHQAGCCANPILDAAVTGQLLYAITKEGLEIYSKSLCRIASVNVKGVHSLVQTGGKLVIAGMRCIYVYDIREPRVPKMVSSHEGIDIRIRSLIRPLGAAAGTVLAILEDGSGRFFQFHDKTMEETAHFSRVPWFTGSVRFNGLLVQPGQNRNSIDISKFGRTAVI
jgi:hypothetical protein